MKIICEKQKLYNAVTRVSKGASQRSTIAALEGIRVRLTPGQLELTGYDLEFGIQTTIDVESDDSGEFVIDAHLLSESVRRFSGNNITIEINEKHKVSMYCDATEFHISAMSAEEYPSLPSMDEKESLEIEQKTLKTMINQTSYAASLNESRPVMTGELFEVTGNTLSVVAIDGYRLAIRNELICSQKTYRFVVPKRTLTEIASMLKEDEETPCNIFANKNHIIFEFNGYTVFSRLLEGEFHNYKSSIPESFETEVVIKTTDLIRCLERCSLLINSKFNAPIQCNFSDDKLNVKCETGIGKINDTISAQISGPDVRIGFNNRYLLEAMKASDCDQVKIQLTGGNRVAKVVPMQGDSFIFLLMPIQLKG